MPRPEVLLLGTGAGPGWPDPTCACAACDALRRERCARGPTAILVGGTLLLGWAPDLPGAAARAGASLADVRHLLLHGDDAGADDPGTREWLRRLVRDGGTVDVLGPEASLRSWASEPGVGTRAVAAGTRVDLSSYAVTAAPSSGRLAYEVVSGDLALVECAGADVAVPSRVPYDVVLLRMTGDAPAGLAALRARSALGPDTAVVAVDLGHDAPPPPELARRVGAWGATSLPDGARLGSAGATGPAAGSAPGPGGRAVGPRRTLVLGGARSGKSEEAERRLRAEPEVLYVATAGRRDGDAEWARRVAAHRDRRPAHWRTVETTDLEQVLRTARAPVLVDCLGLWLTAVLDEEGAWEGDPAGLARARDRVAALTRAWDAVAVPVVAVSNEVGSGVVPATRSGRVFRDELGRLNATLAAASDEVVLVVAGLPLPLKPAPAHAAARTAARNQAPRSPQEASS